MHNKEYALKLVQDKINGLNNYSYSQIANLTGYKKLQIVRFSNQLKEKDIDSILVHGLTNKPSNNSPSPKEIEFIKNFKNKYPVISISFIKNKSKLDASNLLRCSPKTFTAIHIYNIP